MKRFIFVVLMILFLSNCASASISWRWEYGNANPDLLDAFMRNPDFGSMSMDTITLANGLTIDNATDNALEINENTDELIATFGSNLVTLSSGDVLTFSFGTLIVDLDKIKVGATTYTMPASDGTNGQVIKTNGSGVLSFTSAGAVTSLDTAYDGGSAITADGGAVAISNTDADAAFLMTLNASPSGSAASGGLQITCGSNATQDALEFANSGTGYDIYGTGGLWTVTKAGVGVLASLSTTAGLSTGTTLAAGTTLSVGTNLTVTGNATVGGNADIGDAVTDTLTITSSIDGDVYLDDGSGAPPSLILKDGSDETAIIGKVDNAYMTITTLAADGLNVLTGNFKVGNGTPGTAAMDGEDFYVEGDVEIDGSGYFDGAITFNNTVTFNNDVTLNDQLSGTFASNDEEIAITNTATDLTAASLVTFIMAAQDNQAYILRLQQTPDADADNDYLLLEDNAGDDKVAFSEGGTTTWTLDAGSAIIVDSDVNTTVVTGIVNIDGESATTATEAVNIKMISNVGSGEYCSALEIDLDDDTGAASSLYGINMGASDVTGSAVIYGLNFQNTIDQDIAAVLPAAGVFATVDAATTDNTVATGVLDIDWDSRTAGAEAMNIKATHLTGGSGQTISALEIELDADSSNAGDTLRGIYINASDVVATGFIDAIYVGGGGTTAMRAALQADFGYVRIGTGSSPGITPGDDDLFVEGTIEGDGAAQFDGGVTSNGNVTATLAAAGLIRIDANATANTGVAGVLDMEIQSATNNHIGIDINYELEDGATQAYGVKIDVDDDATGGEETFDGINIGNSTGTASTVRGLVLGSTLDDGIVATVGGAKQAIVIDATIQHTDTDGVIDVGMLSATNGAEIINLDLDSNDLPNGASIAALYIDTDDDSNNNTAAAYIRAIHLNASDVDGNDFTVNQAIYLAGYDVAMQADNGYLRLGTGSTPDITPGDDDAFIEGTLEVDANSRFDGTVMAGDGGDTVTINSSDWDITAAGAEVNIASIGFDSLSTVYIDTITVSSTDIKTLFSVPKTLVSATAASVIELLGVTMLYDYATEAYANAANNMTVEYKSDASGPTATGTLSGTGFLDQTGDMIAKMIPVAVASTAKASMENQPLVLYMATADPNGGAGGNAAGVLRVKVEYVVHPTGF